MSTSEQETKMYASTVDSIVETIRKALLGLPHILEKIREFFVKATAETATAEKATAETATVEKATAETATVEKATAEKATAEKATEETATA